LCIHIHDPFPQPRAHFTTDPFEQPHEPAFKLHDLMEIKLGM
jgi:hypothetical protein